MVLSLPLELEVIGLVAGTLTTFCWLPQAIKIVATRDTKAISLVTQLAFTLGCTLWIAYGFVLGSPSIVVFNIITACLAGFICVLKLRFG